MKKTLFSLLFAGFLGIVGNLNAQVVAVINRADWCHVCEENGPRVMKEIMPAFEMDQVEFIMNDFTTDKSKAESMKTLEKAGIYQAVKHEKMTGNIVLINKKSGKEISRVSVAKSTDEIKSTINKAVTASK